MKAGVISQGILNAMLKSLEFILGGNEDPMDIFE
jgi:hypothetical protein